MKKLVGVERINKSVENIKATNKTLLNAQKKISRNFSAIIVELYKLDYIQFSETIGKIENDLKDVEEVKKLTSYKIYNSVINFSMLNIENFNHVKNTINNLKNHGINNIQKSVTELKRELKRKTVNVRVKPAKPVTKPEKNYTNEKKDSIKAAIVESQNSTIDVMDAIASLKKIKTIIDGFDHKKLASLTENQLQAIKAAESMLSAAFK